MFQKDSPICRKCVERLKTDYDVSYSPPEKVTKLQGHIKLIAAIKEQAEEDVKDGKDLEAIRVWEHTFLESKEWKLIWSLLKIDELF
jgi:hypothetical protein